MRTRPLLVITSTLALLSGAGFLAPSPAAASGWTVVASGLNNPRDLAFGPSGTLYVAEAGTGGAGGECIANDPGGEEGDQTCADRSGALTAVQQDSVRRVVTGLVSIGDGSGFGATGPDGLSVHGNGGLYTIMTGASDFVPPGAFSPALHAALVGQLGRVIKGTPGGSWKVTADVGHPDFQWTQEHHDLVPGQYPDANPYGIVALPGVQYVVDAGANTLDRVNADGTVTILSWFPNPPASDAVPTCIEQGPDGALYVGQLTGVGNGHGAANIYRVVPGQDPQVWASGLTSITGCGFGADGRFYATEFSTDGLEGSAPGNGDVVRVPAHSTSPVVVASGLSFPGGFAAGSDGSLYVSNWSIAPADSGGGPTGQVVRITL